MDLGDGDLDGMHAADAASKTKADDSPGSQNHESEKDGRAACWASVFVCAAQSNAPAERAQVRSAMRHKFGEALLLVPGCTRGTCFHPARVAVALKTFGQDQHQACARVHSLGSSCALTR